MREPFFTVKIKVAWVGGGVGQSGGVGSVALLLLEGLLDSNVEVDIFAIGHDAELPSRFARRENLRVEPIPMLWEWGKWYSRNRMPAFASGLVSRVRAYRRMVEHLRKRHVERHYDVVFQMSQSELFSMGRYLAELPPVVIFPCVHAAGELRWHRRESAYAREAENPLIHYIVRMYLIYRSWFQRREMRKPAMIIGMSNRFNELVREDYGVEPARQAVIYNPIDTANEIHRVPEARESGRPLRLLFIARISVRKGVEQIIELSRRLDDLAGQVELHVIGGATMWSDYRKHLEKLNPKIAKYLGAMPHEKIMSAYNEGDALLLPSHYEPGGIVVGEALSRGLPVVVNEEIGSAEPIEGDCCRRFRAGDMDSFEYEVRRLLTDLRMNPSPLRNVSREQARRHFAPDKIAREFLDVLQAIARRRYSANITQSSIVVESS